MPQAAHDNERDIGRKIGIVVTQIIEHIAEEREVGIAERGDGLGQALLEHEHFLRAPDKQRHLGRVLRDRKPAKQTSGGSFLLLVRERWLQCVRGFAP